MGTHVRQGTPTLTRQQVLRSRAARHQLDRTGSTRRDAAVLDLGVQDTGEGAAWALALRGAEVDPADLVLLWTLRGAPHAYRRPEVAQVAAAVAPADDADAAKRIFDASKPLKEAGIGVLDALDTVAGHMREVAARPVVKGEMSTALTERLDEPYLRWCNPCQAVHSYEQTFRLAAIRAGLELEPGTSPPVLRRIPRWRGPASAVPPHLDVVRAALHLTGPATVKEVAAFLDSPVATVKARWPEDAAPVEVDGVATWALADDLDHLADPPAVRGVRLLGAFDLFLQGRDREVVLPDRTARADLWRTIGRPGGLLVDGEVVGSWRAATRGDRVTVTVTRYDGAGLPPGVEEQAERLAAHRGKRLAGVVLAG